MVDIHKPIRTEDGRYVCANCGKPVKLLRFVNAPERWVTDDEQLSDTCSHQ